MYNGAAHHCQARNSHFWDTRSGRWTRRRTAAEGQSPEARAAKMTYGYPGYCARLMRSEHLNVDSCIEGPIVENGERQLVWRVLGDVDQRGGGVSVSIAVGGADQKLVPPHIVSEIVANIVAILGASSGKILPGIVPAQAKDLDDNKRDKPVVLCKQWT